MAVFRCKMCGGDLEVQEGATSCVCEFCGTRQTLPSNQDENLQGLFNRANVLRIKSEFDKAADIYEKILQTDETEAEAYWGLILCKYGIEYVEDPTTYKRIPTCHRASYDAVTTDEDYKNALKYADAVQREIYEAEAAKIDEIQRGILAIAQKESPYDVFICYKETDDSGNRTQDSVIANDIYYQLNHEGFKIFYAAISLEDKLGSEYEPVIFSALNTAKVMLVLGTKPEYFNAVWVKNEWSRFLKIMKKDRTKLMIPCYKDMDPYELPEEFAHLQAQNMGKIGFINDLVRGIQKVIGKGQPQSTPISTPVITTTPVYSNNVDALLKRGYMALEDGDWEKANGFFEDALNQDAECARAYIGKFLIANQQSSLENMNIWLTLNYHYAYPEKLLACQPNEAHVKYMVNHFVIPGYLDEEKIRKQYEFDLSYNSILSYRIKQKEVLVKSLNSDRFLLRAVQYAKGSEKDDILAWVNSIISELDKRIQQARLLDLLNRAMVQGAYVRFINEANQNVQRLWQNATNLREMDYQKLLKKFSEARTIDDFWYTHEKLCSPEMLGYKNSSELARQSKYKIDELKKLEEDEKNKRKQKVKKNVATIIVIAVVILAISTVIIKIIIPQRHFTSAIQLISDEKFSEAFTQFSKCNGYNKCDKFVEEYFSDMDLSTASIWASEHNLDESLVNYIKSKIQNRYLRIAKIGDIVNFGANIDWIVLDQDDSSVLLISKDGLKNMEFSNVSNSWKESNVRKWLNNDFYNTVFTNFEKNMIVLSRHLDDYNARYDWQKLPSTNDKVFILSITEAQQYFNSNEERMISEGSWVLRSPVHEYGRARVTKTGRIDDDYGDFYGDLVWVRPVIRVKIDN